MPAIRGKPKEQISYKCPHDLFQKINTLIDQGKYASRNDIMTEALRMFFENQNRLAHQAVRDWFLSDEGEKWMKDLIRDVINEP
jgi:Arc/MetJ-type ribon-helix-helix transcriptional regulator